MFPLSKIIFLGALLTSSSGIGIFLIPYLFLRGRGKTLNRFLKVSTSSYNLKNTDIFDKKEFEKLEKLNLSFLKMKEAKWNSRELQKFKNDLMKELFEKILKIEEELMRIYQKSFKAFIKLQENNNKQIKRQELSYQLLSKIKFLNHSISLLQQARNIFWSSGDAFNHFICLIEKGDQNNSNCDQQKSDWISKSKISNEELSLLLRGGI